MWEWRRSVFFSEKGVFSLYINKNKIQMLYIQIVDAFHPNQLRLDRVSNLERIYRWSSYSHLTL